MKTGKLACNYAIIRFLPYPETEEFVNVGVVVACPAAHYFDFRIETQRSRVTGFFPELDKAIFLQGRNHFRLEMARIRRLRGVIPLVEGKRERRSCVQGCQAA